MGKAAVGPVQGAIAYAVPQNTFGDTLPIIPSESTVAFGSVLFRLDIEITVTRGGAAVSGETTQFRVSGVQSNARMLAATDKQGKATLRLETRILGDNTITPTAAEFAASTFVVTVGEAWFAATFKITAYNCCDEDDFTGDLVDAKNVGKRKKDFLFSGRGVCMQGTGVGTDGKYISISNPGDIQWNPGYAGVKNTDAAVFVYSTGVNGAYGALTADGSIAIDPTILPKHHRVDIIGPRALGERKGDDTGGAITGHHFDNYAGAGKAAIDAWTAAGGNIEHAVVKYLGA